MSIRKRVRKTQVDKKTSETIRFTKELSLNEKNELVDNYFIKEGRPGKQAVEDIIANIMKA